VLDYTGQDHDLYSPEIEGEKPVSKAEIVEVVCPQCGVVNEFWGLKDTEGEVVEHFGRKCQGLVGELDEGKVEPCGYLFRFKRCEKCGAENDIAARECYRCEAVLVDPDQKLREAMSLRDAHVMRVDSM